MTLGRRANEAEDALQVDVYLESLLAIHDRAPHAEIDSRLADELDPPERRAAELLAGHLVRFHPSFRFEEALAARLRAAAARPLAGVQPSATVLVFPAAGAEAPASAGAVAGGAAIAERARPGSPDRRRVLIGGAIASGVSLAGAALFAWRASTPPRSDFARATRAAHRGRSSVRGRV